MRTDDRQLDERHREYLAAHAIDDTFMAGCYTAETARDLPEQFDGFTNAAPGLVFPWVSLTGAATWQVNPDDRERGSKYLFPADAAAGLSVLPWQRDLIDDPNAPIMLVEGTKQHRAVASAAASMSTGRPAVLGMAGCWGWSSDGEAHPDLYALPVGRDFVLAFDADIATNEDVWEAAKALAEFLAIVRGAASVRFLLLPSMRGGKSGLDDVLARVTPDERTPLLARMIAAAKAKLPGRPASARSFVGRSGLMTTRLWSALEERHPMAVTAENCVTVYANGVYHNGESLEFEHSVASLLGDDFRKQFLDTITSYGTAMLRTSGAMINETSMSDPVANFRNGLVDLTTGKLYPHTPAFRSMTQFPMEWDADAKCPTYDAWLSERTDQRANLHEVMAQMFLPGTPHKSAFLFGPSRSGKSTFLRLAELAAGERNRSGATLHQLAENRFMAAGLYGKVLNIAADLPSRDVNDLSLYKMLTGEDVVRADRKFGQQFEFTNRALFLFCANEVPSVGESANAYMARMVPVAFPSSYLGHEDTSWGARLAAELPGIVRAWVAEGVPKVLAGDWTPVPGGVLSTFAAASDAVRSFLDDKTEPVEHAKDGMTASDLYTLFRTWSSESGRSVGLTRDKFLGRVLDAGVERRVLRGTPMYLVGQRRYKNDPIHAQGGQGGHLSLLPPRNKEGVENPSERASREAKGEKVTTLTTLEDVSAGQGHNAGWSGGSEVTTLVTTLAAPLPFDLETGSLDDLHRTDLDYSYIRLCGTPHGITPDPGPVTRALAAGQPVAAHNGFAFDFLALARHHGLDLLAASEAGLLVDSKILAFLADPPEARMKGIERHYGLNATAERLGHAGKTDDIKRLAKLHGGFHLIPQDDPEYRAYLAGDVAAMAPILAAYPLTDYARREMRVLGRLVTGISLAGWRVDSELLRERHAAGEAVVAERTAWLRERFGLPTTRKDGSESKRPHATAQGREAIDQAFSSLGVELPRTEAGGPALGKDVLGPFRDELAADGGHPEVLALVDTVLALNGVRTVYGSVLDHVVQGRTHSTVDARQASGRVSVVNPGLTVMGKRGGKYHEREVFLPDEGEVLVAFDMDQIDMRAIAGHCQDPAYMELFAPGRDVHSEIAQRVFGTADRREDAKRIGHGHNYGMSIEGLVRNGVDRDLALTFDSQMREQFPRLAQWRDEVREEAQGGRLLDNGFGRLMRPSSGREHTQAPALIGQGGARDLMMEGLLRVPLDLVPRLRAVVHDELVFSLPAADADDAAVAIVEALTFTWRDVPITAGRSRAGSTWGGCYAK